MVARVWDSRHIRCSSPSGTRHSLSRRSRPARSTGRVGDPAADELAELWEAHGLREVSTGELSVEASYESFDDLFEPLAAGAGHSGACFAVLDSQKQHRLRDEATGLLGRPPGPLTYGSSLVGPRSRSPH